MNSLKPVLILGVLLAIVYGVYTVISGPPKDYTPPPGAPENWQADAPQVDFGTAGSAVPQIPGGGTAMGAPGSGGYAAPYTPGDPSPSAGGMGTTAPPYNSPAPPYGAPGSSVPPGPTPSGMPQASLPPGGTPSPYPLSEPPTAAVPGPMASPYGASMGGGMPGTNDLPAVQSAKDEFVAKFDAIMQRVNRGLAEDELAGTLDELSRLYVLPEMPEAQASQLTKVLDQLAGTVIYSRKHLLEPAYIVRPGETLDIIANAYNVPWQLLARINGISHPDELRPGQELKVVRGPFEALIDLDDFELTLMLDGRYAGRFPIGVGRDHVNLEGSFTVRDKMVNPEYHGQGGHFRAGDPNNPYGKYLINLGNQIGIHGTNDPYALNATTGNGAIRMSDQDIDDIFGILSDGPVASKVTIRR